VWSEKSDREEKCELLIQYKLKDKLKIPFRMLMRLWFYYNEATPNEVQLYGEVQEETLKKVYMPEQVVSAGATNEVSKEVAVEFFKTHGNVNFWVHSHPNSSREFLSETDKEQIRLLGGNGEFWAAVMAQDLHVYYYKAGVLMHGVKWTTELPKGLQNICKVVTKDVQGKVQTRTEQPRFYTKQSQLPMKYRAGIVTPSMKREGALGKDKVKAIKRGIVTGALKASTPFKGHLGTVIFYSSEESGEAFFVKRMLKAGKCEYMTYGDYLDRVLCTGDAYGD